ncbi:MAG: extracellular solute-binding protein [Clostridia bacterium]|nr:extracellular solute-binding protein [Clostridia bacterium]
MKRFFSFLLVLLMLLPVFTAFGCGKKKAQETKVIRVCNCDDYIDMDLIDEFEAETGIDVVYSTFSTNENLYNELVINPNSYDLVVPSEYMIQKLAVEGKINKLDHSKIAGYDQNVSSYISNRLKSIEFTVESGDLRGEHVSLDDFMVGYMWGTMGWVYNTEHVSDADVKNWYSPFNNQNLSDKITIKDSVRDSYLVGLAMVYKEELYKAKDNAEITQILNRVGQEDIDKVGEILSQIKPMLYGFEVDSGKNDIVLGNIDAYIAWSGDAAYAIDVASGKVEDEDGTILDPSKQKRLSYNIPEEGSNIWFDGFVMPSGSQNYDVVCKFLEFISRPEVAYRNMDYIGYTSMIANGEFDLDGEPTTIFDSFVYDKYDQSATLSSNEGKWVDLSYFFGTDREYKVFVSNEEYGRLIAQYPDAQIVERCAVMSYFDGNTLLDVNEMWEKVKGETFPIWLLILFASIILLLAVFMILYRNRDKIRWFKLPERKRYYAERKGLKVVKKENL